MGKKTFTGTGNLFNDEQASDTMHEKEKMTNVRIRAERIAVLEFMKRELQRAENERNENLAATCRRIIQNYEELLEKE